ncbi:MAG: tonB-system energizer ExbB [Myxococcales bacterium]|nr:tonB-system energizer ExbB [Myxococcales bacterium]
MWQGVVPVATGGAATAGLATSPAAGAAIERGAQAATATTLNPWDLILNAGPVVTGVLVVLLAASVICWAVVVAKAVQLGVSRVRSRSFLKQLRLAADDDQATELAVRAGGQSPHARLWLAARHEREVRPQEGAAAGGEPGEGPTKRLERTLSKAVDLEVTRMEGWLSLLATIGSASPFVGLFGTVWGIMSSFINIGAQESASLAIVAPGIAEALIATAVGLVAAIPAVVAYNAFVRRIRVWNEDLAAFAAELVNQEDAKRAAPPAAG